MPTQAAVHNANGVTFEDIYDISSPDTAELVDDSTAVPSRPRDPRTGQYLPNAGSVASEAGMLRSEPGSIGASHPGHLVAAAKNVGLDDETIAGMSTAELRQDIHILSANRNSNDHQSAVEQERINRAVQQQIQQQKTPQKPGILDGLEEFDHESLKAVLTRIVEKLSGFETIEQRLNQVYDHVGRQAEENDTQRLDRAFSELPDQYKQFVGSGTRDQYTNRDFEYMVRANLFAIAQKLAGNNATVEGIARKIPEAASRKFPDTKQKPGRKQQVTRQRDQFDDQQSTHGIRVGNNPISPQLWNNSGLSPASHRQSPEEPRGRQRAQESVQSLLSQLQGQEDNSEPTSLDEFL